jgi:hypothetical protein
MALWKQQQQQQQKWANEDITGCSGGVGEGKTETRQASTNYDTLKGNVLKKMKES